MRHRTASIVLGFLMAAGSPAGAAIFLVDSTADEVDATPGNGSCATLAGTCTLRAAVQEANALAGPDTIVLPAGVFVLTRAGDEEDFAETGDLDVRDDLTIEGAGAGLTTIDGNGIDRVLHVRLSDGEHPDLTLRDVTITGGQVTDVPGGGLYFASAGIALVERTEFTGNHVLGTTSSAVGGAISSNAGGNLTVRESRLAGNSADRGGALFSNSFLLVEDSTIADNDARAGSALVSFGSAILRRSVVSGNEATGNYTISASTANLDIEDATLSSNIDPFTIVSVDGATLTIRNVTIANNDSFSAVDGFVAGTVQIINSIVYNPLTVEECTASAGGQVVSLGYTLDRDGTCATGAAGDLPSTDPLLGPLADNGGPTHTHLLLAGSPAIDAGDNFSCTLQDQRGVARPQDGDGDGMAHCDLGAVEVPEPGGAALGLAAMAAVAACARRRRRVRGA